MSEVRDPAITPYDRLNWSDDELEFWLATGQRRRELMAVFGVPLYTELARLAQQALACAAHNGARVWLLPGIMGSRLGRLRADGAPPDTLWLDPLDIIAGRLPELTLHEHSDVRSLGILHFSYLQLKLQMAAAGFAVRAFDYDWRRDIAHLGERFAAALRADGRECMIVAHSMGGLVARSALTRHDLSPCQRLLLLGTPNRGSWATVQALRGSYAVVRRLSQLDRQHDVDALTAGTFHSFQSLHDLLPGVADGNTTLLAPDAWPHSGLQPDRGRLHQSRTVAGHLLPGDQRSICIAGFGEPTAVAAQARDEFVYDVCTAGDGTVALDSAELPGARCYYTRGAHSLLTRQPAVLAAIVELLCNGDTHLLATARPAASAHWQLSDTLLRAIPQPKIEWATMTADERRTFLDSLSQPLPFPGAT